jgi:hypothetical protein
LAILNVDAAVAINDHVCGEEPFASAGAVVSELPEEPSFRGEDLHACISAVGDVDVPVRRHRDTGRFADNIRRRVVPDEMKLSGPLAWASPAAQDLALGRDHADSLPGIRDVEVAVGADGKVDRPEQVK